jgi:hypothetical protein
MPEEKKKAQGAPGILFLNKKFQVPGHGTPCPYKPRYSANVPLYFYVPL